MSTLNKSKKVIKGNILSGLIFIYFIFQPIYLWKSGYPQVSDLLGVLIVSIVLIVLFNNRIKVQHTFLQVTIFFLFYILFINLSWAIILNEHINGILSSAWYVYNIIIMLTMITILNKSKKTIKMIQIAVLLMIVIELIVSLVFPIQGLRAIGTFNNPNQLGYFSLLYLSIFYLSLRKFPVNNTIFWMVTISAIFIALLSLSKATMLSIVLLVLLELLIRLKKENVLKVIFKLLVITFIILLGRSTIVGFVENTELYGNVSYRIMDIGKNKDDNLEGRGYDRIFNHPEYLLLGAGEVDIKRFKSFDGEIHSTFGNLFFSYGVIGLALFLGIIISLIKGNNFTNYYYIIPLFLYSLTHNGIRNTILWILFALIYYMKHHETHQESNSI